MVILIGGSSHTGKTLFAQKLLEKYHYPYLSIDHLKMGLIRSGHTSLTPNSSDQDLTDFLWPIVREMIKTNLENHQNLIVEGCYIPFDFKKDFKESELEKIKYICLIFSEAYIEKHYNDIRNYENEIEKRWKDGAFNKAELIETNLHNLEMCKQNECDYILMDQQYEISLEIVEEKWKI